LKIPERCQRRAGGFGIIRFQSVRNFVTQSLVDQIDGAGIFLARHPVPNVGRIDQIGLGLFKQRRQFFHALDNVAESLVFRSVVQHVGRVERIASELYIGGGIVLVALDFVELEQVQADIITNDTDIGTLLLIERRLIEGGKPAVKPLVKRARRFDAGGAPIVERFIERHSIVLVIAAGGGSDGRKSEAAIDKVIHQLVEILGGLRFRVATTA